MKKRILATLLLAFAGISLAETPKIVNPPRPNKNYRWLLMVKSELYEGIYDISYFYTDKYKVTHGRDTTIIGFKGRPGETCRLVTYSSGQKGVLSCVSTTGWFQHEYAENFSNILYFLKAKAPGLKKFPYGYVTEEPFVENVDLQYVLRKPQKAKVVFTK